MDSRTFSELLLTAVIALFAGLTWWATRTYAYISGLTLFIETNRDIIGTRENSDRLTAIRTMRALRKRFPRVYEDMRDCMNQETRDNIEK